LKKNIIINLHVVENPKWFENLIIYLKTQYKLVPLSFFDDETNYSGNNELCSLTFDDGHRSVYDVVFPILKKHNVPAAIFISPRSVQQHFNFWFQEVKGYDKEIMVVILVRELDLNIQNRTSLNYMSVLKTLSLSRINELISIYQQETNTVAKPFLNLGVEEVKELRSSGLITFGAHTLFHPILRNEENDRVEYEISNSISELSVLLGEDVKYFAYPNGTPNIDFGEREILALKKNNIKIALSTEPKFVNRHSNKMMFPRIGITKGSILFIRFRLYLGPIYSQIKSILLLKTEQSQRIKLKKSLV
jgi:peptidoglycan/xylan/chitin deacetylase (PgdA/CDA1 family)